MHKKLMVLLTIFLIIIGCSNTIYINWRSNPTYAYTSISCSHWSKLTERDEILLFDNHIYSINSDASILASRNAMLISTADYIKHQQNLDSIVKIVGMNSDSLSISIYIVEKENKFKNFWLTNENQISAYIIMLQNLLDKYGYVPIPEHYQKFIN